MNRLALLFKNAQTLAFIFRLQSNTPDGNIQVIRGFVEKPNKFRVEELDNGKLSALVVSDGNVVYAYQASTRRYRKMSALTTYASVKDKAVQEQTTALLGSEFLPVLMFFGGDPGLTDFQDTRGVTSYYASATLSDGSAITRITEIVKIIPTALFGRGFQYDLDTKTGLLHDLRWGTFTPRLNSFDCLLRFSFSTFRLGKTSLPAPTFAWNPPTGSILGIPSRSEPTIAP